MLKNHFLHNITISFNILNQCSSGSNHYLLKLVVAVESSRNTLDKSPSIPLALTVPINEGSMLKVGFFFSSIHLISKKVLEWCILQNLINQEMNKVFDEEN